MRDFYAAWSRIETAGTKLTRARADQSGGDFDPHTTGGAQGDGCMSVEQDQGPTISKRFAAIPGGVWALGFVSMFMDISSEMIHSLLPVFLVTSLGACTALVGLIEGIGEATASMSKLFSGWLSDRLGKRKALTILGYGLGALAKPFFALASTASWVLAARFSDRLGKGIRGAPRDAMVGDITPPALRGAAYGLR
jgi:MFS family permease